MKRFRFSMEQLSQLRAFEETQAENLLRTKAGRVALLERSLMENATEVSRTMGARFSSSKNVLDFLSEERYLTRLAAERQKTLEALALAELERQEALGKYSEAAKRKKLMDELEDGERGAYRKEAERYETMVLDDLGAQARARAQVDPSPDGR